MKRSPEREEPEEPLDPKKDPENNAYQTEEILRTIEDGIKQDEHVHSLLSKLSTWTPDRDACFHTTQYSLTVLKRGIANLENNFTKMLEPIYLEAHAEIENYDNLPYVPYDKDLYQLFYQNMNRGHIKQIYKILANAFNSSEKEFLTPEARNSRLGIILHSYIYKLLTGLGTQYTSTEAVLSYVKGPTLSFTFGSFHKGGTSYTISKDYKRRTRKQKTRRPNLDVFSDLRNLCLLLRDTLGLVNFFFRAAWPTQFPDKEIGNTQYCHSGGNIFYLMSMMLCYLHRHQYQLYGTDILEQIRYAFDQALGDKDEFYEYLDAFMANATCRELIFKNTLTMSDVDFLLLTDNRDIVDNDRDKLKNVTMIMAGQIVSDCCEGLRVPSQIAASNIAFKVVLPKRRAYTPDWPAFKISDFTGTDRTLKDWIYQLEQKRLNGVRITASDIEELQIILVRIKVAIDAGVDLSDEFKRIFSEKLDFVIGSMTNAFYSDKQSQFTHCDYYSLTTFLNELVKILSNSEDDKSSKRWDRYYLTHLWVLIENMAVPGADPAVVVQEAVRGSSVFPLDASGGVSRCWFSLLIGTLFQHLDPTTRNRGAAGCSDRLCNEENEKTEMSQAAHSLLYESLLQSLQSTEYGKATSAANADAEVFHERHPSMQSDQVKEAYHVLHDAADKYEERKREIDTYRIKITTKILDGLKSNDRPKARPRTRSVPLVRQRSRSVGHMEPHE